MKIRTLGRCLFATGILVGAAAVVYFTVDTQNLQSWIAQHKPIVFGALFVVGSGLFAMLQTRKAVRVAMQESSKEDGLEPDGLENDPVKAETKRAERAVTRAEALRFQLKQIRSFLWAYDRPWILVSGDDASVKRLLPELAKQYWLITDHAVLLWGEVSSNGVDRFWLQQIYRMRRNRPIDAIVLAFNGAVGLPSASRGTTGWGTTLARFADVLHWSAPVYVLEIDGEASTNRKTPVIGCEFASASEKVQM